MAAEKGRWPLMLVRRGERVGSEHPEYVWWQELPHLHHLVAEITQTLGRLPLGVPTFSEVAKGRGWRCEGCGFFTAEEPDDPCPRCTGAIWERTDA